MKPKIAIVVIAAFCVLAIIACGYLAIQPRFFPHRAEESPMISVLVCKKNLQTGMIVKKPEEFFEEKEMGIDDVPKDAICNLEEVKGRQLKIPRRKGDFITSDELLDAQGLTGQSALPPGYRAVSLNVDSQSGAAGFATLPLSRVDIVCTDHKTSTARIILENVLVLAADDSVRRDEQGNAQPCKVVTLTLLPEDALKLIAARETGALSLMLRPFGETKIIEPNGWLSLPEEKSAKLPWAQSVAIDFLTCIHKKDRTALLALMTDRLRSDADKTPGWIDSFFLREFALSNHVKSAILSQELSPEGTEAVFRGELHGFRFETDERIKGAFTMRVLKEGETGQWRVGVFSCDVSVEGHGK